MFYRYYMYTKGKDILRTFEPDNHKMLRTSQPQNFFAGPYKKKSVFKGFTQTLVSSPQYNILDKIRSWQ